MTRKGKKTVNSFRTQKNFFTESSSKAKNLINKLSEENYEFQVKKIADMFVIKVTDVRIFCPTNESFFERIVY